MQSPSTLNNMLKRIPSHLIVAGSAWMSRIITAAVSFLSVRVLTETLGTDQYAVFALLTGLMGWYMLGDMGIGTSLQNYISEQRAKKQAYNDYILLAATLSIVLLLLMIVILYLITPYLAPLFLKRFGFFSQSEKIQTFFMVGALFLGTSIGGIAYKIWYGEQKGYLANIIPAIASLISLAGIWWVSRSGISDKLYWSSLAYISPPTLLAISSFLWQVICISKDSLRISGEKVKNLIKRAFQFWSFAILAAGVLQIDYIVMSQFAEVHDIVVYNIVAKVYLLITFIYNSALMALWPVCTEMITRNDWKGVIGYLKRYLLIGMAFMIVSILFLIWLMPYIIKILSPSEQIFISVSFIVLLGIYQMIRVWTDTFAMVLQSMSNLRPFWIWVPLQAILSVSLQWILGSIYGIWGIVFGLIGSYLFTVIWALPLAVYRYIKGLQRLSL